MRTARIVLVAAAAVLVLGGCGPSGSSNTGGGGGGGGSGPPLPGPPGTPVGSPAAAPIGSQGGSVASRDGFLVVAVPAGAVSSPTTVTVQEVTNLAPGGIGPAWRLGPEGATFRKPVTVTLYAGTVGRPVDELGVTFQDDVGYWHRVAPTGMTRDPVAKTVAVQTSHFSSWSFTTTSPDRDLTGTFHLSTTAAPAFSATGTATYTYAGEDDLGSYYLLSGSLTIPSSLADGATTCTVTPPETLALATNIGELSKAVSVTPTPAIFRWGTSGHWNAICSGASALVTIAFDSEGITYPGCAPVWTQPEASGIFASSGALTWDCTAKGRGQISGDWDFKSAACGQPCHPTNPCKTGIVLCTSGAAICTENGDVGNGTLCALPDNGFVCSAGACVACTAGVTCSTNPTAATCVAGVTSCATGTSTCADTSPVTQAAPGTTCGTNQVCTAAGACLACTAGVTCSTNPTAATCVAGVTSCATGTSNCADTSPATQAAPGTTCGTNQVCTTAGACLACTAGLTCSGQPNPCYTGVSSCLTGAPTCVNGVQLPNGTNCGGTNVCNAGACVATRTVSGSRLVTWWPDIGPQLPVVAPDVAAGTAKVVAWSPSGPGWASFPGSFDPLTGNFSIPGVPIGSYLLQFTDGGNAVSVIAGSADVVDLGYDALGRSDQAAAPPLTPVTLVLDGLAAWDLSDEIQITASNADVWDRLAIPSTTLAGAVATSPVEEWSNRNAGGGALSLLAPADVLFVHQLVVTDAASALPYLSASRSTSMTSAKLDPSPVVPQTLTPASLTPPLPAGSLPSAAWNVSTFEGLLAGMSGTATTAPVHVLTVGASVGSLTASGPASRGTPSLLRMQVAGGTTPDPTVGPLTYGQFLTGAPWNEWLGVEFTASASYVGPGSPAPTALAVPVSVGQRQILPLAATPPPVLAPALSTVQSALITPTGGSAGSSAFSSLAGLGPSPTFSWTAPATGTPTRYTVDIYRLDSTGGATLATRVSRLATTATSVAVPPGTLVPPSIYFARITAWSFTPDPLAAAPPAPFRQPNVFARAETLTGIFAP